MSFSPPTSLPLYSARCDKQKREKYELTNVSRCTWIFSAIDFSPSMYEMRSQSKPWSNLQSVVLFPLDWRAVTSEIGGLRRKARVMTFSFPRYQVVSRRNACRPKKKTVKAFESWKIQDRGRQEKSFSCTAKRAVGSMMGKTCRLMSRRLLLPGLSQPTKS